MRVSRFLLGGLVMALLAGCTGEMATDVERTEKWSKGGPLTGARGISVMTQNIYLGADLTSIYGASDASQIPELVAEAWRTILSNDFPARAQAIARLIEDQSPHLIGLQEVAMYRIQSPSGPGAADNVVLDYLGTLRTALGERGLDYVVVAVQEETDVELPMLVGVDPFPMFDDLRMTLRDVILARRDVSVVESNSANYQANYMINIGPAAVVLRRGWNSTVASIDGTVVRFVNTHLEGQLLAPVQEAQAGELLVMLEREERPLIVVGDFNSAANVTQTSTYDLLRADGFVDTWNIRPTRSPGLTCCHDEALLEDESSFDQRLDLIFARGFGPSSAEFVASAHVRVVGAESADRTDSGLWPSDHAGVAAVLRVSSWRDLGTTRRCRHDGRRVGALTEFSVCAHDQGDASALKRSSMITARR